MDSLNDNSALPELSFDDLLDESPIKKFRASSISDDTVDTNVSIKDQSLHTPGPKRKLNLLQATNIKSVNDTPGEILLEKKSTATVLTTPPMSTTITGASKLSGKTGVGSPILLNNKIALSPSSKTPQKVVKITTATGRVLGSATTATGACNLWPQTISCVTTIGGKTALKTANGQIVYLKRAPTTTAVPAASSATSGVSSSTTTSAIRLSTVGTANNSNFSKGKIINVKPNSESPSTSSAAVGNTTLAIQLVRSADGKLVPLKTTAAGTKNALTLSPTVAAQLAGKKIVTSSGNQVVLKAATTGAGANLKAVPATTTVTSNVSATSTAASTSSSAAKPFKIQKIMAPSASVLAKNPTTNILNAAQGSKPVALTASSAGGIVTTSMTAVGVTALNTKSSVQTVTSPSTAAGGKILVQSTNGKQIVVTNSQLIKLSPKTNATLNSSGNSGGSLNAIQIPGKPGIQYVRVVSAPKKATIISEASTAAAAKLLNAAPTNKLDIVRANAAGSKFVLTSSPKNEGSIGAAGTAILSPSKVQKTMVTVPTIRNISNQEKSLTNASETSTVGESKGTIPMALTVLRPKAKITEINSEFKRITATPVGVSGELAKKVVSGADGKRYVVIQPQQQKLVTPTSKVIVKSGVLTSSAGTTEGAMKSFIICKSNQSNNQSSDPSSEMASGTNVVQLKKPLTPIHQHQQQQQQQQSQQILTANSNCSMILSTGQIVANTNSNMSKFVPIKIKEELLDVDDINSINFSDDPLARGGVRRKHCNCSKSQCLKLYCDCFANGEFCQDCTCKDCFNNLQFEDERSRAIRSCLERNPSAFKPKITSAADQGDARLHNKGCNCKRSGCLKNYCECFEAKIPCSNNCKCVGCRNVEDRPDLDMDPIDPKILETIANASNATNTIARAVSNVSSGKREHASESDTEVKRRRGSHDGTAALLATTQLSDDDEDSKKAIEKRNANFITQEVIDATIQCMISQADECLKNNLPAHQIEKMVIEELGRCLVEIIDFSIRNTDNSFTQN